MRILGALCILAAAAVPSFAGTVVAPVPEPSTMLLMGGGLAGAILFARSRRKK